MNENEVQEIIDKYLRQDLETKKWYFWNRRGDKLVGPWNTEEEAIESLKAYKDAENGKVNA